MNIIKIADDFYVSDTKTAEQLPELQQQGFKSIICHRIVGEAEDFIEDDSLKAAAQKLGLDYLAVPVQPLNYGVEIVLDYSKQLATLPKPILSFCRSGTRAAHMWLKSQSLDEACNIAEAKATVKAAGFSHVDEIC